MSGEQDIWVVVEHSAGQVKSISLEAIRAARDLAGETGGQVVAVSFQSEQSGVGEQLLASGPDRVCVLVNPAFKNFNNKAFRDGLLPLLKEIPPRAILMGATNQGKELLAGLSAALGVGLATDCISMTFADGFVVKRPVYSGKAISTLKYSGSFPYLLTLRPNIFRGEVIPVENPTIEHKEIEIPDSSAQISLKKVQKEEGRRDITEAGIVISGGMGMQGPDQFSKLEELADLVDGAVGASRPVVDEGWRPYSNQVGQTGRTVSPNLYIACGISGAVQHLAGMSSAPCIVAINKDPNAPIFDVADFGIVGDALEVVPALTQAVKETLAS